MSTGAVVFLACGCLVDQLMPLGLIMDHTVDGAPVGETSKVAVINKHIDFELAAEVVVVGEGLLGIVTVNGVELYAALTAPVDGLIKELTFTNAPEYQLVTLGDEHSQGLDGKGNLWANLRITMLYNRSIKINSD